jgi:hypothetical protein
MDCFRLRSSSYGGKVALLAITEKHTFAISPRVFALRIHVHRIPPRVRDDREPPPTGPQKSHPSLSTGAL